MPRLTRPASGTEFATSAVVKLRIPAILSLAMLLCACGSSEPSSQTENLMVGTETEEQWAQYEANARFALEYEPTCVTVRPEQAPDGTGAADPENVDPENVDPENVVPRRPRVLVTGYGRFGSNRTNATGLTVSALLPELEYPMTDRPPSGEVDEPGPQTAVAVGSIELPLSGPVDVCAMVIPVYWDLAAILVLREIEAFNPDFVLMNGIAGGRQPLWIELGSVNSAMSSTDGSGVLEPEQGSPLIPLAAEEDRLRGLLLSWGAVQQAAETAIAEHGEVEEDGQSLQDILSGAKLAGFPRHSNTYLCNNVAYTVGYLMDHGETTRLLEPSHPREGFPDGVDLTMTDDHTSTPRVFMHWPSQLRGAHIDSAAEIMKAMIDAQLVALADADGANAATRGTNDIAEIQGSGGNTF